MTPHPSLVTTPQHWPNEDAGVDIAPAIPILLMLVVLAVIFRVFK